MHAQNYNNNLKQALSDNWLLINSWIDILLVD